MKILSVLLLVKSNFRQQYDKNFTELKYDYRNCFHNTYHTLIEMNIITVKIHFRASTVWSKIYEKQFFGTSIDDQHFLLFLLRC